MGSGVEEESKYIRELCKGDGVVTTLACWAAKLINLLGKALTSKLARCFIKNKTSSGFCPKSLLGCSRHIPTFAFLLLPSAELVSFTQCSLRYCFFFAPRKSCWAAFRYLSQAILPFLCNVISFASPNTFFRGFCALVLSQELSYFAFACK